MEDHNTNLARKSAIGFVVLFGIVSLFADMTYEGARSLTGPYLQVLGASAFAVGLVTGLGEFIGYALRLVTGWLADRTKKYWIWTIFGYGVNVLAVPALALAGHWVAAAILLTLERIGKAIRNPSRDALLSFARQRVGSGWTFALHKAMDQTGAVLGPVIVAVVLFFRRGDYPSAFLLLAIPAILTVAAVIVARNIFPHPEDLEVKPLNIETGGLDRRFWWCVSAMAFVAFGYADFPLLAYHFMKVKLAEPSAIPLLYALAMVFAAVSALVFGFLYDRVGKKVLFAGMALSAFFAPFAFTGGIGGMFVGALLWGVGMGWIESVAKSIIADLSPKENRAGAFGLFHTVFGAAWFAGSALLGFLYDIQWIWLLILVSVVTQLAAIPLLIPALKK